MTTPRTLISATLALALLAPAAAPAAHAAKSSKLAVQANAKVKKAKRCGSFRKPCEAAQVLPTLVATTASEGTPAVPRYARIASRLPDDPDQDPLALTVENDSLASGTAVTLQPFLDDTGNPYPDGEPDTGSPYPTCATSGPRPSFAGKARTQFWRVEPDALGGATLWSGLGNSIALGVDLTQPAPYPVVTNPSQIPADAQVPNTSAFQSWTYDPTSQTLDSQAVPGNLYASASGAAVTLSLASGPGSQWYAWPSYPLDSILSQQAVKFPDGCDAQGENCDLGEQEAYAYITVQLGLDPTETCTLSGSQQMNGIRCQYANADASLTDYHEQIGTMPSCVGTTDCPHTTAGDWNAVVDQLGTEITYADNVRLLHDNVSTYITNMFLSDKIELSALAVDAGISTDSTLNATAVAFVRGVIYTVLEAIPGLAAFGNMMEALGNTAAAARGSTLTTTYVEAVAAIDKDLATAFEFLSTANDIVETAILTDWGKLAAVGPLTTKLSGPDSLAWPSIDFDDPNDSVLAASTAGFTVTAMQVLLPVKYSGFRYLGQVDDSLPVGLCSAQWAETADALGLTWNKFTILDAKAAPPGGPNPPGAAAIDDVVQNGASLHDLFNGTNGWEGLAVLDTALEQEGDLEPSDNACNIASVELVNSTSGELRLTVTPHDNEEGVVGGNGAALTGAGFATLGFTGSSDALALNVPRYSSATIAGGFPTTSLGIFDDFQLDVTVDDLCLPILNFSVHQHLCRAPQSDDTWTDSWVTATGCSDGSVSYLFELQVTDQDTYANTAGSVVVSVYEQVLPGQAPPAPPTPPTIVDIRPLHGNQGDTALPVRISGSNFEPGAVADFGPGTSASCQSTVTEIECIVAIDVTHPTGTDVVTVTNPDGGQATWPWSVLGAIPTITALVPDSGFGGTSLDVAVTGSSFAPGATCDFGPDITVASCVVASATQVIASIGISPTAATGPRTFTLADPDGNAVGATFTVLGEAPDITGLHPLFGLVAGATTAVSIVGENFQPGARCDFGEGISETPCTGDARNLETTITVAPDAKHGFLHPRTVTVTNPDGQVATFGPVYVAGAGSPRVYETDPLVARRGGPATVTFTGVNFAAPLACELRFLCPFVGECPPASPPPSTAITVDSCTVDAPTQVTAEIAIAPDAPTGLWVWGLKTGDAYAIGGTVLGVLP